MPISYNYSGDYNDIKTLLRKFTLQSLLKAVADYSSDLLSDHLAESGHPFRNAAINGMDSTSRKRISQEVIITAWELIDLSYWGIVATNDYRGKAIESVDEFNLLCSAISSSTELRDSLFIEQTDNRSLLYLYLWGFCGEQFKFQDVRSVLTNFSRDVYLLLDIAPKVVKEEDYEEIIARKTGTDWLTLSAVLYLAWRGSYLKLNFDELENRILWDECFTRDSFNTVIERYTASYSEVKDSNLKRQFFYTKPFIKTDQPQKTFCVNCYLGLFLLEHCIYWVIRDYYNESNNQLFTATFGKIFEEYLRELFAMYLPSTSITDLDNEYRQDKKHADWLIRLDGYKFIIEQKSALLALNAKQQDTNLESICTYAKRNINKALQQLHETENRLGEGTCIKVILLYEDYFPAQLLSELLKMEGCPVKDDGYYWLMNIGEMEMLLQLYDDNRDLFSEVIQERIRRTSDHKGNGVELLKIMHEFGISQNRHIEGTSIKSYRDAVMEKVHFLLGSNCDKAH